MNEIIQIQGNVKYQIHVDPSLWIFDDRRFEMSERFPEVDGLGMEFGDFLKNAEPTEDATKLVIYQRGGGRVILPLEHGYTCILQFARAGKPIHPDGPALLFLADGSNRNRPVDSIEKMEVV